MSFMDTSQRARALSDRLLSVRRDVRRAEHRLALLLAEMADADLHKALGYATIGEYAAVVLEVEPRQARELVRLGRRLPELPHLDAALAEGRLDWTKAREVIRVATPETDAAWVARAIEVSSRALEQDVADAVMGEPPPESASEPARAPARRRVVFEMEAADAEVLFQALLIARTNAGASRTGS